MTVLGGALSALGMFQIPEGTFGTGVLGMAGAESSLVSNPRRNVWNSDEAVVYFAPFLVSNPRRNVWNRLRDAVDATAGNLFQIPEGTFGTHNIQ